jgi:hypothetical protein
MNPDPEQFARAVLWHLAGARAELSALEVRFTLLEAHLAGKVPSEATGQEWARRIQAQQERLYLEACRAAGLQIEPPPSSPPTTAPDTR